MVLVAQPDSNEDSQGRQLCMNKRLSKVVSSAPRARFQKARPKVPSLKRDLASASIQTKSQPLSITERPERNKEILSVNGSGESNSVSSDSKGYVSSVEFSVCQSLLSEDAGERHFKCDFSETKRPESDSSEVVFIEDKAQLRKEVISSSENNEAETSTASVRDQNGYLVSDLDKCPESCSASNTKSGDTDEVSSVPPLSENTGTSEIYENGKDTLSAETSAPNADENVTSNSVNVVEGVVISPSSNKKSIEISAGRQSSSSVLGSKAIKSSLVNISNENGTEISASSQSTSLLPVSSPTNSIKKVEVLTTGQNVPCSIMQNNGDSNSKDTALVESSETSQRSIPNTPTEERHISPSTTEKSSRSIPNTPTEERNDISPSTVEKSSKYPHLTSILSKKRLEPKRDVQHKKRKRYKKGDTAPERSKMTMEDLIYWNPTGVDAGLKKVPNVDDTPLITNDVEPEECPDEDVPDEEENPSGPVPRLIISEDGEINIDQGSLVIQRKTLPVQNVIERNEDTTYASFRKRPLSKHWTTKDTTIFYKALSLVGTDFGLMEKLLPNRSRRELKLKFKREEKYNIDLVNKAMYDSMLTFDENTLEEHIQMLNSVFHDDTQDSDQSVLKENKRSKSTGKRKRKKDAEVSDKETSVENGAVEGSVACNKRGRKKKQLPGPLISIDEDIEEVDSAVHFITDADEPEVNNKGIGDKNEAADRNVQCNKRGRKKKQLPSELDATNEDTRADENSISNKGRRKKQSLNTLISTDEYIEDVDGAVHCITDTNDKKVNEENEVINNKYETSSRIRKKKKLPDDFISIDDVEDITELTTGVNEINDDFTRISSKKAPKNGINQCKSPQKSPAPKTNLVSDKTYNETPDDVEIVYLEELTNVDPDFNQGASQGVVIAEGPAETLPYSSDHQETECITVNIIQNYDEANPLNVVMANEVVTSETLKAKRKRNAAGTVNKVKKDNSKNEYKHSTFTSYTPKEETLLTHEKHVHFSPEPNLKTYSKVQCTPPSANVLISSLQAPAVTPVQSSSLLTSLNMSSNQPMTIPLTPQANASPSPVMFMAKSPNTDNVIHLFMYKSPPHNIQSS